MRDSRFKARSVCKVTSASGIGKLPIELTRALVISAIGFLGLCPRLAMNAAPLALKLH
jgi:hypothetical protein